MAKEYQMEKYYAIALTEQEVDALLNFLESDIVQIERDDELVSVKKKVDDCEQMIIANATPSDFE